ncbi:molybdenum cofactor biosynthesis protein MoaE [Draconibacterium halophilum]|uniref:Molybdopterin synthase catalytic subunit n=1 Tax=Draconibacterium halophilum TaxID=2706887 RepID=A0A6C0RDV5_9BACT|nr:molybdenum cofactor biosynthesis protein MoaE [Draconibacterium halophilum]QIA07935.1 molybdenum cofactor biosynthesis protein MoaE [Draconibacterium halophilum]
MKHIQNTKINYSALFDEFRHPLSGAVVLFSGEVRDNNKGRDVTHLEYEAYAPMANKMISEILAEAKSRFKLNQAACVHRVGRVEISGCAVVVITGSGHRKEAYDANRYIIDRVKGEVPIWKHEFFADGTSEWGQNCDCNTEGHDHHNHYERAE